MPTININGTDYALPADDAVAQKVPSYNEALIALAAYGATARGAHVTHNAAQSIANATLTKLAFNTERFDTDTIHDNATNNTRLTCKTAGKYLIIGQVAFATNATGEARIAQIKFNNVDYIGVAYRKPIGGGVVETLVEISTVYDLAVNDYVELVVYQDSGGALNVNSSAKYSPEFSMMRMGA